MSEKRNPTIESRILHAILYDMTDRRGLRQAWDSIDSDIQRQIKIEWRKIIRREIENERKAPK